ncbi:hypothetical protein [Klebsiella michiganensis]|uniref:hypothetical protein n=1 Tax=Klebsiella michiganensis TaxID=1134687 RepID=UPI001CCB57B9|nr:hypothetical protein [Klebsiella michiganensis]MBZ6860922.1 hypothetical protein [Klebsiella michiganensis]MBZ7420876.1 hypothetical protein [Klebsiella michiganensis]MDS7846623.1 hypothetical protein [Klebsiella michiganensis]MDS7918925.1 hypothetical protein [Klebsiella michiganensis]MDU6719108.1 hypothetical protein [Klebsiella michiganensis]
MLDSIIRSYMYTQYNDDDNLRAFFTAYNSIAQGIYDWMVNANLPVFIGEYNTGDQLRWISHGIYGVLPPVISSSEQREIGPYNTLEFNQLAFNEYRVINQSDQVVVSDDLFKRIMTWNFYKGDGFYFSIPWIKRRILRFLLGINGTDILNDQRWSISIQFVDGGIVISIYKGRRQFTRSAIYNASAYNSRKYNQKDTAFVITEDFEFAIFFKQAMDSGLLHMPFYQSITVEVID